MFNPLGSLGLKLIGGLLVAILIAGLWARGNHYRADRDHWHEAFDTQRTNYIAAQDAAKARAEAQRIATENRYAELARKADAEKNDALRAAAARFARLRSKAACGPARNPATAAPADTPGDHPEPGADTVVLLTRPEYDQFVENTLRLEAVRRWGESLVQEKLAIPEVGFGPE